MEVVLHIELEILSLIVLKQSQISEAKWNKKRYEEFVLLDKRRLQTL